MTIHATAQVAPGAELADDVEIGPYCIVGGEVKLGAGVRLRSHVVIEGQAEIGAGCELYPFVMLGGVPQHAGHKPGDPCRLVIGERNLIREHVTMHGGSTFGRGVTRVGHDNVFYVGAHVGHDCIVGNHVTLTNAATLAGHVTVDDFVIIGGLAAVLQRCRVGRYAFLGGLAGVVGDVIPYGMVWGNHARLEGLNLVGLKRKGFSRETINTLRAAQKDLFSGEGFFKQRIEAVAAAYAGSPEVMEIVEFIRAEPGRPLTMAAANLGG